MEQGRSILEGDLKHELHRELSSGSSMSAISRHASVPRTSLSKFQRGDTGLNLSVASALYNTLRLGPHFIRGATAVQRELEYAVERSHKYICAIGSHDTNRQFLDGIGGAVNRGVVYRRVVHGVLTPQLEAHLNEVEGFRNVELRYLPAAGHVRYQNLIVVDEFDVIMMLGEVHTRSQSAMKFTGQAFGEQFLQYFQSIFLKADPYSRADFERREGHDHDEARQARVQIT